MVKPVKYRVRDGLAIVTLAAPPMNVLTPEIRGLLADVFDRIAQREDVRAVALFGEGAAFSAGVDLREHAQHEQRPTVAEICRKIEDLPVPVVAGLHGQTLSGGVAIALAAHYRLIEAGATLTFPDARLSLVPNAGATQRLPRLVGAQTALSMLADRRPIDADAARQMGIADGLVNGSVGIATLQFCEKLMSQSVKPRPTRQVTKGIADSLSYLDGIAVFRARPNLTHAQRRIIDAVEAAILLPFDIGLTFEQEAYADLRSDPAAAAHRHFYVAERRVPPWLIGRGENGRRDIMAGRGEEAANRLRAAFTAVRDVLVDSGVPIPKLDAALARFGFAPVMLTDPADEVHPKVAAMVQRRMVGALMAEGARLIADRVVQRASDVDVLSVVAVGFPRARGGPMYAAQVAGLDRFWLDLRDWAEDDPVWAPNQVVIEAVKQAAGFDRIRAASVTAG